MISWLGLYRDVSVGHGSSKTSSSFFGFYACTSDTFQRSYPSTKKWDDSLLPAGTNNKISVEHPPCAVNNCAKRRPEKQAFHSFFQPTKGPNRCRSPFSTPHPSVNAGGWLGLVYKMPAKMPFPGWARAGSKDFLIESYGVFAATSKLPS
eukprot:1609231-Rhodomonas_salina.1